MSLVLQVIILENTGHRLNVKGSQKLFQTILRQTQIQISWHIFIKILPIIVEFYSRYTKYT